MERKRLIAVGAIAVAVAAAAYAFWLGRRSDEASPVAPGATSPAAAPVAAPGNADATPLTFAIENEHVQGTLTLPPALKAVPELHRSLYAEGARDLQTFADGAMGDRTEMEGEGLNPRPYAKEIRWSEAGSTGKLASLRALVYEDTGGAHPNSSFTARIWDKAMHRAVSGRALFAPRADLSDLDTALCDAIKVAKKAKTGETWTPDETWSCPKLLDTQFVLTDGPAGRAGGLLVLLPPYMVGPYAEGAYEVPLPASVLKPYLAPAYADEFAG